MLIALVFDESPRIGEREHGHDIGDEFSAKAQFDARIVHEESLTLPCLIGPLCLLP